MISVLICSNKPTLLEQVRKNIEETIGIEFEIIFFDNREFNRGICTVYNELACKAKFSYLCFIHEDVLFRNKDWGHHLINNFLADSKIGLIGLAGCKYKSAYISGWFSNVIELDCANFTHQYNDRIENIYMSPSNNNEMQEVVCIDGVFMCATKEAWDANKFNESFLKGFHFYDIDFSLNIASHHKVMVTYNVDLIHITTGGDYNDKWVEIAMKYHSMKKKSLPFSKISINVKLVDKMIIKTTMDFLKNYKISFANKLQWIVLQKLYLFPKYYYSIIKFFLYKPLKLELIHNLLKRR